MIKGSKLNEHDQSLFGIDKLNVARSQLPAVTHVDYSARIQTVHEDTNPRYYRLLEAFENRTDCPVLINTSFNVRGEPNSLHARRCVSMFYAYRNGLSSNRELSS